MKLLFPILSFLLSVGSVAALEVDNVNFSQATDGSKLVTIQYTLSDATSSISLGLSLDGGETFQFVLAGATGAIGPSIPPGQHSITLDFALYGQVASNQVQFRVTANVIDMLQVPAGQFVMGQVGVVIPEHEVTLTNDFLLGRTEVTNAQYLEALNWANEQGLVSIDGDFVQQYGVNLLRINQNDQDSYEIRYNPGTQQFYLHAGTWSYLNWGPGFAYPGGSYAPEIHPVKNVSWYGAACYCDWLSQMENLPPYYNGQWGQVPHPNNPYTAYGYRLPTEAEWEFAAQHDDERTYPWGNALPVNCVHANYDRCIGWTSPVGSHLTGSSALGMQDMAGNVWEMCNDWYASYSSYAQTNPAGPSGGYSRVLRNGGWGNDSTTLTCVNRNYNTPYGSNFNIGFRLCRTIP